jgi:hypothetical protein
LSGNFKGKTATPLPQGFIHHKNEVFDMNKKLKQIIFPGSLSSQCNLKNPHELRFHEKINGQKQNSTTLNQMITQELLVLHGVAGV